MQNYTALKESEISNQCVLVCDLNIFRNSDMNCWLILKGTQSEIGEVIARKLSESQVSRLDDFGGVCKTFLCEDEEYLTSPPKTKPNAAVFSFTPKKRVILEAQDMARVSASSGYELLVLTLQKHDKFGKVWVLCAALSHMKDCSFTYYEDTSTVVDEIKASPEGRNLTVVHVQSPGFEMHKSLLADRVITQQEYKNEVLAL